MPADAAPPLSVDGNDLTIREVPVDVVVPLRHAVLRAGHSVERAHAKQDGDPDTRHFAAFAGPAVVGVVTQFPDPTPLAPSHLAERFRGMAVDPAWQGRGIGRRLMQSVALLARSRGADVLWANGRDTALGFYTSIGFRVAGDGFVDDEMHLGHHVVIAHLPELHL